VELKQIKELMSAMEKLGIKKLMVKEKSGYELHLERAAEHPCGEYSHSVAPMFAPPVFRPHEIQTPTASGQTTQAVEAAKDKVEGKFVTSPMVGTFYKTPSPEDPPFVKVGDKVDENTVVCIIEAMKVMNEVKAGVSGVIAEICIDTGKPVEFGTKLFRII
jgi:acetyl-CoA carboxylase biotin carboxyl carrier protein